MHRLITFAVYLLLVCSCSSTPSRQSYLNQYAHIDKHLCQSQEMSESDYFLVILVDARHLDYSNSQRFLQTFTKHPANGSKEGSVGHAWILLKGKDCIVEGGHTGEYGIIRPRYVDGINQYIVQGDPNPVRYLWEPLNDGVFQKGAGGHTPSYAAKFDITEEQFHSILTFIHPKRYPYENYSLTGRQCTSLVAQVAALADIHLDTEVRMKILQQGKIAGCTIPFWRDPQYAELTFSTPDILEKSLMEKVQHGEAECALSWYFRNIPSPKKREALINTLQQFPYRYHRHRSTL